jgi:hypothetical protein
VLKSCSDASAIQPVSGKRLGYSHAHHKVCAEQSASAKIFIEGEWNQMAIREYVNVPPRR